MRPLLYTYRRCPYAMRARMALLQAGLAFDAYEIVLRHKPAEMLGLSPKGTVPVMQLPDGRIFEESLDIMRWALGPEDVNRFWARSQASDHLDLITLNDDAFKQQLDRYKYPERFPEYNVTAQRDAAMQGLIQQLEQRLSATPYLGGSQPCATDLAIFPFIRQFRSVEPVWFDMQGIPATQRWLKLWLDSKLFTDCMKKLPSGERVLF